MIEDRQSSIDITDPVAICQQAEQWQLSGWLCENKYKIEDEIHTSELWPIKRQIGPKWQSTAQHHKIFINKKNKSISNFQ